MLLKRKLLYSRLLVKFYREKKKKDCCSGCIYDYYNPSEANYRQCLLSREYNADKLLCGCDIYRDSEIKSKAKYKYVAKENVRV